MILQPGVDVVVNQAYARILLYATVGCGEVATRLEHRFDELHNVDHTHAVVQADAVRGDAACQTHGEHRLDAGTQQQRQVCHQVLLLPQTPRRRGDARTVDAHVPVRLALVDLHRRHQALVVEQHAIRRRLPAAEQVTPLQSCREQQRADHGAGKHLPIPPRLQQKSPPKHEADPGHRHQGASDANPRQQHEANDDSAGDAANSVAGEHGAHRPSGYLS